MDWLKTVLSKTPKRPAAPTHEIFAIGYIHGRYDFLSDLLEEVFASYDSSSSELVFLGDYIDRGPQSREVIDLLLELRVEMNQRFAPVFLKGNHEATLLDFLNDPGIGPLWMQFGGAETLMSYGVRPPEFKGDEARWAEASRDLRSRLPKAHLDFFQTLLLSTERGCYFFAHAGVDPSKPIEMQSESDLLWVREPFLDDDWPLPRIIVHGHTPEPEPYHDNRRIGLDLGGYQTGRMAAARIRALDVDFITV